MGEITGMKKGQKRLTGVGVTFTVLGILLFAYFVNKAGISQISENIADLGYAFLIILGLAGLRVMVRATAWFFSFEKQNRLPYVEAVKTMFIGDAIGNLVPFISEPAKAVLIRHRVPLVIGFPAVAVENLFYSLSVTLFILSGLCVLLYRFSLPNGLRYAAFGGVLVTLTFLFLFYMMLRRRWKVLTYIFSRLSRLRVVQRRMQHAMEKVSEIEERIYNFYFTYRKRFFPILMLEISFHLLGVTEVFVTLWFISDTTVTLLMAFILESVNRVINVVFKVFPFRVGIDEAGSGLLARILNLGTATGVTLALIRKARILCWTGFGILLLIHRGFSIKRITHESQTAMAETS
jgi:hypothetical protein